MKNPNDINSGFLNSVNDVMFTSRPTKILSRNVIPFVSNEGVELNTLEGLNKN